MKKRVKRIVASGIILAGILANGVAVSAAPKAEEAENNKLPFTDVSETDWFYSAVEKIYDGKIMLGPEDNKFSPYEKLARAQLAVIVHRMEEEPKTEAETIFEDVSGTEWYGKPVLWAAENGIVTGYENGYFGPADQITREQTAVILYRYAKYKGEDVSDSADVTSYKDAESIQPFAKEGMNWAVANGIVKGKDLDGDSQPETLDPQGSATRAECAVMIQRFMDKYQE